MLHWQFHSDDQIPVNCLFTKWKRTHIAFWTLKLKCTQNGSYGQSGLQECKLCFTSKLFQNQVEWTIIYRRNLKFSYLVYGSCLEVPDRGPLAPILWKFHVRPDKLPCRHVYNTQSMNNMHNIIRIHNNVLWDRQTPTYYFIIQSEWQTIP